VSAPGKEKGDTAHRASGATMIAERRVVKQCSLTAVALDDLRWPASGSTVAGSREEGEDGVNFTEKKICGGA
jgi:hypothetical protein